MRFPLFVGFKVSVDHKRALTELARREQESPAVVLRRLLVEEARRLGVWAEDAEHERRRG